MYCSYWFELCHVPQDMHGHASCGFIIQAIPLHFHPPTHPGTMVVHFLTEAAREKYELEKLWTLGHHHDDQYQSMQRILEEQLTQ